MRLNHSSVRSAGFLRAAGAGLRRHCILAMGGCLLVFSRTEASTSDLASPCNDRSDIERVYYEHRLGTKPPFEQLLPPATIEQLVKQDIKKKSVLKNFYGVEISSAQVAAEVKRIKTTTRAPGMLADLQKALGSDPDRFARSVAMPLVVERELRACFENDDKLHAHQRQRAEKIRSQLLQASTKGAPPEKLLALLQASKDVSINQMTWQLAPRDPALSAPLPGTAGSTPSMPSKSTGGAYSVEAAIQLSHAPASPDNSAAERKFYFEDLPDDLQQILRAQLRRPGNLSAVVETPSAFLLFLATEKSSSALSAASVSIAKRSYEHWLSEQPEASLPALVSPLKTQNPIEE